MSVLRNYWGMAKLGSRVARILFPVLVVLVTGIILATIGNVLRSSLCLGGDSECTGAKPISALVGNALYWTGSGLALMSPLVPLAFGRWHRRREK